MNLVNHISLKAMLFASGTLALPAVTEAQSDTGDRWNNVTVAAMLTDPKWHDYLTTQANPRDVRRWQDYPAAQEAGFAIQGEWQLAEFCAPAGCADERVIMAFAPATETALLASTGAEGMTFFGAPRGPLPGVIADLYQQGINKAALRTAFEALPDRDRRALQYEMYLEDFYASDFADGRYGPMTEAGLIDYAIARAPQLGFVPNLSDERLAGQTLQALARSEFVMLDAPVGSFAFEGAWSCGGTALALTSRTHKVGGGDATAISLVETYGNGTNFGVLLRGGARIGIWDVTADSLTWASQASGDMMDCRRTGDAPEPPEMTGRAAFPALPVIALDALAPVPAEHEPLHDAKMVDEFPFLGRWSCGGIEFTFAEGFGVNHTEGLSPDYETVAEAEPNVWDITFVDGVAVRVGMVNDARMMMIALEQVMQCERVVSP
ncbi:hypothetical protein [Roseinatronobacter sp. NSM]|uniref:hypothetical protein n=1 Tax=Roseinatronobacter sp. NSM TaxID=3457785 RepID=UPI0040364FB1